MNIRQVIAPQKRDTVNSFKFGLFHALSQITKKHN